jgi:hypothetical protein
MEKMGISGTKISNSLGQNTFVGNGTECAEYNNGDASGGCGADCSVITNNIGIAENMDIYTSR